MKTKNKINLTFKQTIVLSISFLMIFLVFTFTINTATASGLSNISPSQANELIQKGSNNSEFVIIDMRTPKEFNSGHIKGAILIDFYSNTFIQEMKDKTGLLFIHLFKSIP